VVISARTFRAKIKIRFCLSFVIFGWFWAVSAYSSNLPMCVVSVCAFPPISEPQHKYDYTIMLHTLFDFMATALPKKNKIVSPAEIRIGGKSKFEIKQEYI
jgi:hypothetical protein